VEVTLRPKRIQTNGNLIVPFGNVKALCVFSYHQLFSLFAHDIPAFFGAAQNKKPRAQQEAHMKT
jgi:hypothetical protein